MIAPDGSGETLRAVLWDMDGTLVDSEKLWDVAMTALYAHLGGVLSPEVRAATVGGSAATTIRIVHSDLGRPLDPAAMAASTDWLHDYTAGLFRAGLPFCAGAREMLDSLAANRVPMALVTNTPRSLAELALDTIGRGYFSVVVCGDEVARGKPAPDPYQRAAALLDVDPDRCLAIEDSPTGVEAAETAGCPVLVIADKIAVPEGPRRRLAASLADLSVADLRRIHAEFQRVGQRTG